MSSTSLDTTDLTLKLSSGVLKTKGTTVRYPPSTGTTQVSLLRLVVERLRALLQGVEAHTAVPENGTGPRVTPVRHRHGPLQVLLRRVVTPLVRRGDPGPGGVTSRFEGGRNPTPSLQEGWVPRETREGSSLVTGKWN